MGKFAIRSRLTFVTTVIATIAFAAAPSGIAEDEAPRPNILILFTDDQGYADLACYGNQKNKTPRLDQLAKEGTRFTSFYAQTVCGPSRSALLTGRHPHRSQGWGMPASEITIAERLRDAGYQTACIGKWHLGTGVGFHPQQRGFQYFCGMLRNSRSYIF